MKITKTLVTYAKLPFIEPLKKGNKVLYFLESVIFTMESNDGVGQSEACITHVPDIEMYPLAEKLEKKVAPLVEGKCISSTEDLRKLMGDYANDKTLYALVEMAWWNLEALAQKKSLAQVLGAEAVSQQVFTSMEQPVLDEDGNPNYELFFNRSKELYKAGYVHLELKIRPGWDWGMVHFFREENPAESFHLDVEGGMKPAHLETLLQFRDFFPRMIEQPYGFENYTDLAELQEMFAPMPICLDETLTSLSILKAAMQWKWGTCYKINPVRCGGFEAAREMVWRCKYERADCWISAPIQTGVGAKNSYEFSCLEGFTGPFEYYDLSKYLPPDSYAMITPPPPLKRDEEDGSLRIGEPLDGKD